MSIIYSYPEQGALNADDLLIGTSAAKVGGKQKNITRNFSIQQIADFINRGAGLVDPVATDFQIAVFNQAGKKITGSIMSQDAFPGGTGITITGNLTTTGNISTSGNLTAPGNVILGGGGSSVSLLGTITLGGPIIDSSGTTGSVNQILLSSGTGEVNWQNYEAGLTYEGTWDAANNTTNGLSNSPALVSGTGVSGHFYIVNVAGNTTLDTNSDWHVGDWAVFLDQGGQPAAWQKIDNTSTLVGSGTAGTLSKWTNATTLNDSLVSEAGTVVSVNGDLKVKDTIQATTANTNLKLKGVGTGGIEIMSADGITDGKITLNCSQNSHGVTLQSPAHASGATYTLILPTTTGTAGQLLTSGGASPSQLTWTSLPSNIVSGYGTTNTIPIYTNGPSGLIGDSIMSYSGTVISVNGDFSTQGLEVNKYLTDGTGSNGTDGQVLTSTTSGTDKEILWVNASTIGDTYTLSAGSKSGSSVPLNLDAATGSDSVVNLTEGTGITLTRTSATEVTIAGSAQGVTGSGTVNKLPKFDTSTSLNDSIVTQGGGTITITPTQAGAISFNNQTSSFSMPSYLTRNTVTGPTPQVGDVFNFVLTSDLTWAVGGGVIPAGTYPFTITSVGSGLSCNFNSYSTPGGATGTGYTNLIGNGSSTSVSSSSTLSIDGELSMLTNKIINVAQPTAAQDAATKQYVDTAVSGSLNFKGTFNANTGAITSGVNSGSQLYTGTTGGVAIIIGDYYIADTAGNFFGSTALQVGDEAIALATLGTGNSTISSFSVVPSAGAGVTSVLPSSTGLTSSGQPLVITPAGGTGTVTIESTAYAGGSNVGHVPAGGSGGQYLDGGTGNWSTLPAGYSPWNLSGQSGTAEAVGSGETAIITSTNTAITTAVVSPRTLELTSTAFTGGANIGHVPDASGGTDNTKFLKGDGTWAEAASTGGSQIDVYTTPSIGTPNGTLQTFGTLGSTNIDNISQTEVYIDGVYQSTSTYNVSNASGTTQAGTYITFLTPPPTGVDVEIRVVENIIYTNIVTQSFTIPTYVAGNLTAVPFGLYIFTQATSRDLALPINPVAGTSFKVSLRYAEGATTPINRIVRNTTNTTAKIMGLDADLSLDTLPASFEVIWTGIPVANTTFQGWVIVGAGS